MLNVRHALALSALLFGAPLLALDLPPDPIKITKVTPAGTGCPDGSAYVNVSPDSQVFTAVFDKFQAVIDPSDPSITLRDRQKSCTLAVEVHVPAGWQFSVFTADYEGWYDLQQGITMTQTATYHFQGNTRHRKQSVISAGTTPRSGNFLFKDTSGVSSVEWSACGGPRNLIINAELRLASSSQYPYSKGVAGIDSIEGRFDLEFQFKLQWQKCAL